MASTVSMCSFNIGPDACNLIVGEPNSRLSCRVYMHYLMEDLWDGYGSVCLRSEDISYQTQSN